MSNNKEDVTQVPAESNITNHEPNARNALAFPSSEFRLSQGGGKANNDYIGKEANSQGENASFFDENFKVFE